MSASEASPKATGDAPIFVVGSGRSGSTLLRLMLCAHPRIYMSFEASFYLWEKMYRKRASGTEFLRYYFQTFSFRWQRVAPADVLAGLPDPLPRERVGEAFTALMRTLAERHGKVRFGDKTPSHTGCLDRIFRDYPDARVIHIVRDPRGTALSLSRMPWASSSDWANAAVCEIARRNVEPYADRVLTVHMEDLLERGRETMEEVLEFVGEPWDEAVLEHHLHVPEGDETPPVPWLSSSARPRGKPGARWQEMDPLRIRAVEWLCRDYMREYGYTPAELDREPPRWKVRLRALRTLPGALRFAWLFLRLAFRQRVPERLGDAGSDAIFARLNPPAWKHLPEGFRMPKPPPLLPGP